MIDPNLRRIEAKLDKLIPDPFAETLAKLNALNERQAAVRKAELAQLEAIVRGLDEGEDSSSPLPSDPLGLGQPAHLPQPAPPPTEVRLPQRRTHGGDFGPKVRAKLIAEALRG